MARKEAAAVDRILQRMADEDGETWDLQIVLNGPFDLIKLATLAKFKRRAHLKPDVRRRVITAARAAMAGKWPGVRS